MVANSRLQLARMEWAIDTYREQETALSRATEAG